MKYLIAGVTIVAFLIWTWFAFYIPIYEKIQPLRDTGEVAKTLDEWQEWVDGITNMETDYDKILREGR